MQPVLFKYYCVCLVSYITSSEAAIDSSERNAKENQRKWWVFFRETSSNWAELCTNKNKMGKHPENNSEKHQEEQEFI